MPPHSSAANSPLFIGSKPFGLAMLKALRGVAPLIGGVITIDDSDDVRTCLGSFRDHAVAEGLELVVAMSAAEVKAEILARRPPVVLVCGYYWLLDAETLAAVPGGVFGIHNSLLPHYRGSSPLVWTIINGDTRAGSSLFELGLGMDDGPILHQVELGIGPDDGIGEVLARLEAGMCRDLPSVWPHLCAGTAEKRIQAEDQATYCGRRRPRDGKIDWTQSAERIHNFVRAQTPPYPGAFTFEGDRRIVVLRTRPFQHSYYGISGQVVQRRPGEVIVACGGDSALIILEAQADHGSGDVAGMIGPGPLGDGSR